MPAPPHLQLDGFLSGDEQERLRAHVNGRLDSLVPSSVYDGGPDTGKVDPLVRRSMVDMDLDAIWPIFEERLAALLGHVRRELDVARFPFDHIERQLTVHGEADFFTRHHDETHPGTDGARVITFVYYFGVGAGDFEGGTLRLYHSEDRHGVVHATDEFVEISPRPNSIVFFPADVAHEVMPVQRSASRPGGLRCTVNGWYRAGDVGRPSTPSPDRSGWVALQEALVPRVGSVPYSVGDTPPDAQEVLLAALDLRMAEATPEGAVRDAFPDGPPDLVPLASLGDDLVRRLLRHHEVWSGTELEPIGAYGVRIHRTGQTARPQVDRPETHIVTSVLAVAEDLHSTWPLYLRVDGTTHVVHLRPGQMLTYEGASIPVFRPRPLDGDWCALMLVHYRPIGWSLDPEDLVRSGLARGLIARTGAVVDR